MKSRHAVIAASALTLACGLAFSQAQTPRNPHQPNPQERGIDARPYLALGYVEGPIQAILLQRMQATCPAEMKRAVMVDRRAPLAWFGCWRERDGKVEIAFEDGDFLALEHDMFVWLPEAGAGT